MYGMTLHRNLIIETALKYFFTETIDAMPFAENLTVLGQALDA